MVPRSSEFYTDKHLRNILQEHFKDRLLLSNIAGSVHIVCSSNTANKLIDQLYVDKKNRSCFRAYENSVITAADIIKEDIQKMQYDSQKYPTVDEIRYGGENLVPESLKLFTNRVTKKKHLM